MQIRLACSRPQVLNLTVLGQEHRVVEAGGSGKQLSDVLE
jgi:hypothetical protein